MNEYENYYKLLNTLTSMDYDSDKKSVLVAYDTFDNDIPIGVFSRTRHCAEYFKKSINTIDNYVCDGHLLKDRYKIERVML